MVLKIYQRICCFISAKIVVHLHPAPSNKEPGPFQSSKNSYIKLSFKEHGQIEVSSLVSTAGSGRAVCEDGRRQYCDWRCVLCGNAADDSIVIGGVCYVLMQQTTVL